MRGGIGRAVSNRSERRQETCPSLPFLAQQLQDRAAWKAVDRHPLPALERLDRLKRGRPNDPVGIANQQALGHQQLLQLDALIERKMILVGGPWLHERPVAFQPVGQMPNPQSIGGGLVVAEDGAKIVEHEEGRARGSSWSVKPSLVAGTREGLAAHP